MSGRAYGEHSERLQDAMESLKLPVVKYPFVLGQLEVLAESLAELERLHREIGNPRIAWREVARSIANYHRIVKDKRWTQVRHLITSVTAAFASPPSAPYALFAGLMSACLMERELASLYGAMPRYVKLALTNRIMARIDRRPSKALEELGTLALIALRHTAVRARTRVFGRAGLREETDEEVLKREEIASWVSHEVWYHPHW